MFISIAEWQLDSHHPLLSISFPQDKDNTLTHAYQTELHPSVINAVNESYRLFNGHIAILSNSVGSCDDKVYQIWF